MNKYVQIGRHGFLVWVTLGINSIHPFLSRTSNSLSPDDLSFAVIVVLELVPLTDNTYYQGGELEYIHPLKY